MIKRSPSVTACIATALFLAICLFCNAALAQSSFSSSRKKDGWEFTLTDFNVKIVLKDDKTGGLVVIMPREHLRYLKRAIKVAETWEPVAAKVAEDFTFRIRTDEECKIDFDFEWIVKAVGVNKGILQPGSYVKISRSGVLANDIGGYATIEQLRQLSPLLDALPEMDKEVAAKKAPFYEALAKLDNKEDRVPAAFYSQSELETRRQGSWTMEVADPDYARLKFGDQGGIRVRSTDKAKFRAIIDKATEWESQANSMKVKAFTKDLPDTNVGGSVNFIWDANKREADLMLNGMRIALKDMRECLPLFDQITDMQAKNREARESAKKAYEQFK